jgi:hypothetical protein
MKRVITTLALIIWAIPLSAATPADLIQHVRDRLDIRQEHAGRSQKKHTHRSPQNLSHHSAKKRHFRTLSEYRYTRQHAIQDGKRPQHRAVSSKNQKLGHYVGNGWFVDDDGQYDEQYQSQTRDRYIWVPSHSRRQHAYRHYRRQWYLTYLYEHATFNDRHGYHYGYFDRYGFVFDGQFYFYDRFYTYHDRLHGKGLFEHRFYRPMTLYAYDANKRFEKRTRRKF